MHAPKKVAWLAMFALWVSVCFAEGTPTMSTTPRSEPLVWQGAADRKPSQFIAIRVNEMRKEGSGLFGIGNSPSLAGSMPDPRIVEGNRIGTDGPVVKVKAPGGELPVRLAKGSRLVLGLVDPQHVICLLLAPDTVADATLISWASSQRCG